MNDDNLLIICRICGRKTLMHNMRLDDDKENMICNDCYKKKGGVRSAASVLSKGAVANTPFNNPEEKRKVTSSKTDKLVKYVCTSCKYKFSRKESQHVNKCPYCGKEGIFVDSALGADKMIKDSMDKKFDW